MKRLTASVAALAILTGFPVAAEKSAATTEASIASLLQTMQRMAIQYGVLFSRSFIDLTYDSITIEPGARDLVLSGLRIHPELDWDPERQCVIGIERLLVADPIGFEALEWAISLDGVHVPSTCLQPEIAESMTAFGYNGVTIDSATIDVDYHVPSSAASFGITASIADAAEITLFADFDYLWFRMAKSGDPQDSFPVVRVSSVELSVENNGLWQALKPVLAEQFGGDLSAVPQIAEMGMTEALSEGGSRNLTAEEEDLVTSVTEQIARFVQDGDRIVVSATPERSILLDEELVSSPAALIAAFDPVVSAAPSAWRRMIAPAELAVALEGGDELDPDSRLRVGAALVTGIGAPRVPSIGRDLLAPLVERWEPKAALLTARANRGMGESEAAYEMALRALAGGAGGALSLVDALEAELPLAAILSVQLELAENWPGAGEAAAKDDALLSSGSVSGLARRARAAANGRERPRDYASAYYWASLAAAAGDRGAAALRDRLDLRFSGKEGWAEATTRAQEQAIQTWIGGLAANIAARAE